MAAGHQVAAIDDLSSGDLERLVAFWETVPAEARDGAHEHAQDAAQRTGRRDVIHALKQQQLGRDHRKYGVTAELSATELDHLLDPAHYLGQAQVWVERAVAEHNALSD